MIPSACKRAWQRFATSAVLVAATLTATPPVASATDPISIGTIFVTLDGGLTYITLGEYVLQLEMFFAGPGMTAEAVSAAAAQQAANNIAAGSVGVAYGEGASATGGAAAAGGFIAVETCVILVGVILITAEVVAIVYYTNEYYEAQAEYLAMGGTPEELAAYEASVAAATGGWWGEYATAWTESETWLPWEWFD